MPVGNQLEVHQMSTTDALLQNAQQYAANFDKGDLPLPPGR
jgi:carbonic anhydrase